MNLSWSDHLPETPTPASWFGVGLSVYLPPTLQGLSLADQHRIRRDSLHTVLEGVSAWEVKEWRGTDAADPSPLVEVVLFVASTSTLPPNPEIGLHNVAHQLVGAGVSEEFAPGISALLTCLHACQTGGHIGDFELHLGNGTRIRCSAAADRWTVTIRSFGGRRAVIEL